MRKIMIMAASLLLMTALACSKSETVTTSSSETSATVATTTTVATDTTTSTMPVTDTIVTTGSTGSAMSTAPVTSTRSTTTTTSGRPAVTSTVGSPGRGPVTTDTVAPDKRATMPGGKTSTAPSSTPPATSTSSSTSSSSTTSTPPTSTPPMTSGSSGDATLVASGQSTFKSGCTACHGADGSGNTAMGKKNNIPDFRSATTQGRSDAELINIIQNGRGPVSSSAHKAKHLTNDQAKAVVAWIRSLK